MRVRHPGTPDAREAPDVGLCRDGCLPTVVSMRRPILLVVAALAAVLTLAGCSAGASSSSAGSGGSVAGPAAPAPLPRGDTAKSDATGGDAVTRSTKASTADRSVVVTGEVVVTAKDPLAAAERATTIVTSAGGRIDGRSEQAGSGGRAGTATLTLRIPAAKLDATLVGLKSLGHADRVTTSASDVTGQTQDLDARITALRATIQRMLELEQRATDTADLVAIETAIGDRQGELESLEAQQRDLADQVAMSTITLTLQPLGTVVAPTQQGFGDGLATGWSAFVAFWATCLVALGVLLPWLATLVLIGGIVLAVIMLRRRRALRVNP
jgi:hypothetical protein